jgi:predicted permease
VSHRFWLSHLNGDARAIGRTLPLDGEAMTIIGVMPASFDLTNDSEDIWTPLVISPDDIAKRGEHYLNVFARLAPGASAERVASQATATDRTLLASYQNSQTPISNYSVTLESYTAHFVGDYRRLLFVLLGAVSFVLLIACTNVANLLLSRGTSRARELAIRAALGAGRGRLVRQLLTESLVLSLAGAVVGLGVAYVILHLVHAISPDRIPRLAAAAIDWRVLAFTFALAITCSIVFGLVPALRAAGPSVQGTLRDSGRTSTGGAQRDRLRGFLVAAEVALAMTLLTGAGLLIRSAWLVQHVDPGFKPEGVLTARVVLSAAQYADAGSVTRTFERIRAEAAAIPGVSVAALGSVVPLSGSAMHSSIRAGGTSGPEATHQANLRVVSPGYFAAMGIPQRIGRDLTARDDENAPRVVVINEALAHLLWPGENPASTIGRHIDAIGDKPNVPTLREIVGVVGDLHDLSLGKPTDAEFYIPVPQAPAMLWPLIQRSLVVVVRAGNPTVDASVLEKPLKQAVARVDRTLPLAESKTMSAYIRASLETGRFTTILLTTLGAIALVLAMVGVYGVVSYFVAQRTQEIGVRMALGATPRQIWRHVVRRGLSPIVAGVVVGFALSAFTAGVLRSQLYGVNTTDPETLVSVAGLLILVSILATYVPARKAMRVAPTVALNGS